MKLPFFGSLRVRLLVFILALAAGVLVACGVAVYFEADRESQELFDRSLQETGHLLFTLAEHEAIELQAVGPEHLDPLTTDYRPYLFFQIWTGDGQLLYRNNGSPETPFVTAGRTGLGWFDHDGERWRTFALWNKAHTLHMQVGEPTAHRQATSLRFAVQLLVLAAIVLPLLAAMIWWIVHRAFEPLRHSTREVASRGQGDLLEVDVTGADEEVKPLFNALNRLFGRVRQTLEREQRFTADAAHELRTPLAGIKTNLQVLTRARDADEQRLALGGLADSTERSIHLVDQLLTLARVDPNQVLSGARIELDRLIRRQVNDHAEAARAKSLWLRAECGAVFVHGNEAILAILLRNLIDNAIRYTPSGGDIIVSCRSVADRIELSVRDSGPGIPAHLREQVFDRFFRITGHHSTGSGLGLSIVKSIVVLHGATILVADGIGARGTTVTVSFPPAAGVATLASGTPKIPAPFSYNPGAEPVPNSGSDQK
jgi:signal transduction histidine kinase